MKAILLVILLSANLLKADPAASPDRDAAALAFLQQQTPRIHAEIKALEASAPADYRSAMDDAGIAAEEYAALQAAGDAKTAAARLRMYEIDFDAIGIADDLVDAKDAAEQTRLRAELEKLIGASFDQWVIVEAARIQRLEMELAELKKEYAKTAGNRRETVRRDTEQLLEECRAWQKARMKP